MLLPQPSSHVAKERFPKFLSVIPSVFGFAATENVCSLLDVLPASGIAPMFTSAPSINPNEDGFQRKPLFAEGPAVKALPMPTARALAPTKISRCAMLEALALTDTTAKITPAKTIFRTIRSKQLSSATPKKIELHRIHPTAVFNLNNGSICPV